MNNIRKLRTKKQFTQNELAALAGLSNTAVWNHETGHVEPTEKSLRAYAFALDCSVEELKQPGYQVLTEIEWKEGDRT